VIISPWANFLWGRHFNVTPAESSKSHCVESLSIAPLRPVLHRPTLEWWNFRVADVYAWWRRFTSKSEEEKIPRWTAVLRACVEDSEIVLADGKWTAAVHEYLSTRHGRAWRLRHIHT